jgi:hypothetical protein
VVNESIGALAHLGLARAYVMQGEVFALARRLARFPQSAERRRPRHPHPAGGQGGVREAAMKHSIELKVGL